MTDTIIDGVGRLSFSQFSPSELAETTGLGVDMQRVWRKRGHLPPVSGNTASFDAFDVMAIAIRYEFSKLGVSPRLTGHVCETGKAAVMQFALMETKVAIELRGSLQSISNISERMIMDSDIAIMASGCPEEGRFILKSDSSDFEFVHDIKDHSEKAGLTGFVVVDLVWLGIRLAKATPKPFLVIYAD